MRLTTILLCVTGILGAQPTRTETREVQVDAIVATKNGAFVSDLTAKDFHILQDGKEQVIQGFALEPATTAAGSASGAAQPHSLVLFFDETSIEPRDQIPVRQAATSFIDAEAGPNRRMAVVTFDGSVRTVQGFTDDAGLLKNALAPATFHGLAPGAGDSGRSGDPSRIAEARSGGAMSADSFTVRNMIRSLGELVNNLGELPGRKVVILFAGTLSSAGDPKSELKEAVNAANKSGVAVYAIDVRPVYAQSEPSSAQLSPQAQIPTYMQKGGTGQGQPGDAGNLAAPLPDPRYISQEILSGLAGNTGGFVVRNTDLLGGLQKIAQEQDRYYALTYVAPESKEGSCHALRVKVDRKGTTVRARTSYCSAKP
jgi:VWFA-related protein